MTVKCPFCDAAFGSVEDWCPHFIGFQADLTLDDYKDFISGQYPAETADDGEGSLYYFLDRAGGEAE